MTVSEVVEVGVSLGGGDEGLYPIVKKCLNAWIKHEVTLFPFLLSVSRDKADGTTQNKVTSGQNTIVMPSDFYRFESLVMSTDTGVNTPSLTSLSQQDWDSMYKSPGITGEPSYCFCDHVTRKIYLYPTPNRETEYYLRYKRLPNEIDSSGSSDDDKEANEANLGYPDPMTLIRVAKAFTLEWRNMVQEATIEWQYIEGVLRPETKRAALDNRREYKRQRLNRQFFNSRPYGR